MARFIVIPPPVAPANALTDEVLSKEDEIPFQRAWRIAITCIMQKAGADLLSLIDIRRKCDEALAKGARYFELSDQEWETMAAEFRRPNAQMFGIPYLTAAEAHLRAVIDAPTKPPEAIASTPAANGQSTATQN